MLSECLQTDPNLTLEKAKKQVRQKEAVSEQGQQLRGDCSKQAPIVVEQVKGSTRNHGQGDMLLEDRYQPKEVPVVPQHLQQSKRVQGVGGKGVRRCHLS